jgi:hypothetical protein
MNSEEMSYKETFTAYSYELPGESPGESKENHKKC